VYATRPGTLFVNLFVASQASVETPDLDLGIVQETRYPWDGRVTLQLTPRRPRAFTVKVRIPGWARGRPVPSDLYRYVGAPAPAYEVRVNGKRVDAPLADGYAVLDRTWTAGDKVTLHLPMAVRRVVADDRVVDDRGKVALERGPLVYCLEGIDHGGSVLDMVIPDGAAFHVEDRPGLLHGVTVLRAAVSDGQGRPRPLLAVPYYAWSHRGVGEMAVWLTRGTAAVPPRP
jgi:DUF1680 family protein